MVGCFFFGFVLLILERVRDDNIWDLFTIKVDGDCEEFLSA